MSTLTISVDDLHVANDLRKVHEILNLFASFKKNVTLNVDFLAEKLDIAPRQIYFYTKAGSYLANLFIVENGTVSLTEQGVFFKNREVLLQAYMIQKLLEKEYIQKYVKKKKVTSKMIYNELIKNKELKESYSNESLFRRASTIHSWVKAVKQYQTMIPTIEKEIKLKSQIISRIKTLA